MFFDFSSAFNTVWPALLGDKITVMQVDAPLVSWIVDYLTCRPQYVRLQHCVSDRVVSNTGVPQGTVHSPFLFTLYTMDFSYCTETCHLQKFSDDSAIVGCISKGDEEEYRVTVKDFVAWCEWNHLQLNLTKTKELVVDLRRDKAPETHVSIRGAPEVLQHLQPDYAVIFYESVVASTILYAVACRESRLRVADANRLNKLIRKAGDVVGVELDLLTAVSERRTLSKLQAIMDNGSQPLYDTVMRHRSSFSARLILPKCTTERHRRSFLPVAIKLYNSSQTQHQTPHMCNNNNCVQKLREVTNFLQSQSLQTSKLHVAFRSAQEQRRELHGMGFHGRAAASKPYITKVNAKRGMQWCKVPPLDSRAVETCSLE
ncbi:hypothetical protein MHYP_G00140450 [Metynnis hypsauchen]